MAASAAAKLFEELLAGSEGPFWDFKGGLVPVDGNEQGKANFIKRIACLHNSCYDQPKPRVDGPGYAAYLIAGVSDDRTVDGLQLELDPKLFEDLVRDHLTPKPALLWHPVVFSGRKCGLLQINIGDSPLSFRNTDLTVKYGLFQKCATRIGTSNELNPSHADWQKVLQRFHREAGDALLATFAARERITAVGADQNISNTARVLLLGPTLASTSNIPRLIEVLGGVQWDFIIDETRSSSLVQDLVRALEENPCCSHRITVLDLVQAGKLYSGRSVVSAEQAVLVTCASSQEEILKSAPARMLSIATTALSSWRSKPAGVFVCVDGPSLAGMEQDLLCKKLFDSLQIHQHKWAMMRFSPYLVPLMGDHVHQVFASEFVDLVAHATNPLLPQPLPELPHIGLLGRRDITALQTCCELLHASSVTRSSLAGSDGPWPQDREEVQNAYLRGAEATVAALSSGVVQRRTCMTDLIRRINTMRTTTMDHHSAKCRIRMLELPHLPTAGASSVARAVAWDLQRDWVSLAVIPQSGFSVTALVDFFASTAANKPVWALVVADNVTVDIASLQRQAVGVLSQLHVLVLHLRRCHTRSEFDAAAASSDTFPVPATLTDDEIVSFQRLYGKTLNTASQHLFLWGLCAFLRQYEKITSHLQAIGQGIQAQRARIPQLSHLLKICCLFSTYDLVGGLPLTSLPEGLVELVTAPDFPLASVLLCTSTALRAPVTDRNTLAILFHWADNAFDTPDLGNVYYQLPQESAAACLVHWLQSVPPPFQQHAQGQRSELQEICFPLLISRSHPAIFSPFIQHLFEFDPAPAIRVLQAAVRALPQEPHFLAHLGRLRSHAGHHEDALEDLQHALDMCRSPDPHICTMYGNAIRYAVPTFIASGRVGGENLTALVADGFAAFASGRMSHEINLAAYLGEIKFRCKLQAHGDDVCPSGNFYAAMALYDQLCARHATNTGLANKSILLSLRRSLEECGRDAIAALPHLDEPAEDDLHAFQALAVLGIVDSPCFAPTWTAYDLSIRRKIQTILERRVDGGGIQPLSSDCRALIWVTSQMYPNSTNELGKCHRWARVWAANCATAESVGTCVIFDTLVAFNGGPLPTTVGSYLSDRVYSSLAIVRNTAATTFNLGSLRRMDALSEADAGRRFEGFVRAGQTRWQPISIALQLGTTERRLPIAPDELETCRVLAANTRVTFFIFATQSGQNTPAPHAVMVEPVAE